jgi:hypothetical protein
MAFTLDKIVPWGRSFAEYAAMFDLLPDDLVKHILGTVQRNFGDILKCHCSPTNKIAII